MDYASGAKCPRRWGGKTPVPGTAFRVNQPSPPKVSWQRSFCSSTASSKSSERSTGKSRPLTSTWFPIRPVCHTSAEIKIGLSSSPTPNPPANPMIYIFQFVSNHFYSKLLHWDDIGLTSIIIFFWQPGILLPTTDCLSFPLRLLQGVLPHSTSPGPCSNITSLQSP